MLRILAGLPLVAPPVPRTPESAERETGAFGGDASGGARRSIRSRAPSPRCSSTSGARPPPGDGWGAVGRGGAAGPPWWFLGVS